MSYTNDKRNARAYLVYLFITVVTGICSLIILECLFEFINGSISVRSGPYRFLPHNQDYLFLSFFLSGFIIGHECSNAFLKIWLKEGYKSYTWYRDSVVSFNRYLAYRLVLAADLICFLIGLSYTANAYTVMDEKGLYESAFMEKAEKYRWQDVLSVYAALDTSHETVRSDSISLVFKNGRQWHSVVLGNRVISSAEKAELAEWINHQTPSGQHIICYY